LVESEKIPKLLFLLSPSFLTSPLWLKRRSYKSLLFLATTSTLFW